MSFMVCIMYSISDFLPSFFEKNLKSCLVLPKTIAPSPNEFSVANHGLILNNTTIQHEQTCSQLVPELFTKVSSIISFGTVVGNTYVITALLKTTHHKN